MEKNKTPTMVVSLLKKAVAEKGQSAVARETGLTQPAIHRYLKGIGEPTSKTLQKLADYFGVSVWELRGELPIGKGNPSDEDLIDAIRISLYESLNYKKDLPQFLIDSYLDVAKKIINKSTITDERLNKKLCQAKDVARQVVDKFGNISSFASIDSESRLKKLQDSETVRLKLIETFAKTEKVFRSALEENFNGSTEFKNTMLDWADEIIAMDKPVSEDVYEKLDKAKKAARSFIKKHRT